MIDSKKPALYLIFSTLRLYFLKKYNLKRHVQDRRHVQRRLMPVRGAI